MTQQELDYKELEKRVLDEYDKLCTEGIYKRGVLATSQNNHITARRMRLIPDGITLYGWTDSRSKKVDQIKVNPHVAVVIGFIQIEGIATLHGHPLKLENVDYIEAYKRKLPSQYENVEKPAFESITNIEVIKIVPTRISMPSQSNTFTNDVLDVKRGKAYRFTGIDWTEAPAYKEESWVV
jgi:general stress protein 26